MAAFTSKATGVWDAEGQTTWNEAGHPQAADTVTIQNTHTVTLDSATACTELTINSGGALTDVTNNQGLTVSYWARVAGTLTCGTAAISIGSGQETLIPMLRVDAGGVFNGGSGTHTIGAIESITATSILNMTSGNCTIDGSDSGYAMSISAVSTFAHSDGTIIITQAGDLTVDTHSLYKLRIDQAGDTHLYKDLSIASDLTILSGGLEADEDGGASHDLTVGGAASISGSLDGKAGTLTHTGNVTINAGGGYILSSGTTNFVNDITNNNTFTHSSGTVVMTGTNQALIGSMAFWHFTKSVATARDLEFNDGDTFTFGGNVTLNGVSGQLLSVKSLSTGVAFNFNMLAGAVKTNLEWLSVKDSDASGSHATQKPIAPTDSTDVSGNIDWFAGGAPGGITGTAGWKSKRIILMSGI